VIGKVPLSDLVVCKHRCLLNLTLIWSMTTKQISLAGQKSLITSRF